MQSNAPRLVIIDDDPKLAGVVSTIAREAFPNVDDLVIESIIAADAAVLAIRRISDSGETALVVISDFHLPPSSLDGLQILSEVKKRVPSAKRVLMTGRDPLELAELISDAHLDAFVSKPFTFHDMHALITKLVSEVARAPVRANVSA